jgi:hypothetical protein
MHAYWGGEKRVQGKSPLGRTRRRWRDNIRMDLQGEERGGLNWIELALDRERWRIIVYFVLNLGVQ